MTSSRSPYRNEIDALRERKEALEHEITRLSAETAQLDELNKQKQVLEGELRAISEKLGGQTRRALPLLDNVKVASPCNESWDGMVGDERVRFCLQCEKNVFNLSAMTSDEAEALLASRSGELCVRYYQRADGTIMTTDCPVGVKRKRRKKLALAVAGAGAMAFGAMTALTKSSPCVVQGEIAESPTAPSTVQPDTKWMMGDVAEPAVKTPPTPPTTSAPVKPFAVKMGRRAR